MHALSFLTSAAIFVGCVLKRTSPDTQIAINSCRDGSSLNRLGSVRYASVRLVAADESRGSSTFRYFVTLFSLVLMLVCHVGCSGTEDHNSEMNAGISPTDSGSDTGNQNDKDSPNNIDAGSTAIIDASIEVGIADAILKSDAESDARSESTIDADLDADLDAEADVEIECANACPRGEHLGCYGGNVWCLNVDDDIANPKEECINGQQCVQDGEDSGCFECVCVSKFYQRCGADGNVHWYNSCHEQGTVVDRCLLCETCVEPSDVTARCETTTQQSYRQCVADGNVYWVDSCGAQSAVAEECGSGKRCLFDACSVCNSNDACGPDCVACTGETPSCDGAEIGCVCNENPNSCASGTFCLDGTCHTCDTVNAGIGCACNENPNACASGTFCLDGTCRTCDTVNAGIGCACNENLNACASGTFCLDGTCHTCDTVDRCGDTCTDCRSEFLNAQTSCDGTCVFMACEQNWWDLDSNASTPLSNGCEYNCVVRNTIDLPDDEFKDENCDGIDGDLSRAVFVAITGSDTSATCSRSEPCRTINYGISKAEGTGKDQVLIQAGRYTEIVTIADGIGIYGGYDNSWERGDHNQTQYRTVIEGDLHATFDQYMTVLVLGVTATIQNLEIIGPNARYTPIGNRARGSYAVYASNANLTVDNVTFDQGDGDRGSSGAEGTSASTAAALGGSSGAFSEQYSSSCGINNGAPGGYGGAGCSPGGSSNGTDGGQGGSMDTSCGVIGCSDCDATNGTHGVDGYFVRGGLGGYGGEVGTDGQTGESGPAGTNGAGGAANDGDTNASKGFYVYNMSGLEFITGTTGGSGERGSNGIGGGGGGGGGGSDSGIDQTGGGGGGGGGGGCGAPSGGGGGYGGGSSIGLFGMDSTLVVHNSVFNRGSGGEGGNGGIGGAGQRGGAGGLGGKGPGYGWGGDGGGGGRGGYSGGGGGGGGGASVGIFTVRSTLADRENSFFYGAGGSGGVGGIPLGNNGSSGTWGQVYDITSL
jgi:hypothetical protein